MLVLNTATQVEEYDHIYKGDPALDSDVDDFTELYDRFLETSDAKQLPIKPGQKPTVWRLRHLAGMLRAALQDDFMAKWQGAQHSERVLYEACRLGVLGATGLRDHMGKNIELAKCMHDAGDMVLTPAAMRLLGQVDGGNLVRDLGARVLGSMYAEKK